MSFIKYLSLLKAEGMLYFAVSLLGLSQNLVVYLSSGTVPVAHSPYLGLLSASDFRHSQSACYVLRLRG